MCTKPLLMAAACVAALFAASQACAQTVSEVVVTAKRLDAAAQAISASLGATTYSMPKEFIQNLPGGANTQLNQVVLQAPGVAQDSFGQLHVRGDHGNIQYRLNNVILPEGLQVFGQTLSPRLADNIQLITGALPAQYGLRTAGIVNITTKSGFKTGGEVGVYGGSHGVITPSVEYGGTFGQSSAYVSASYTGTDVGIESPDGRGTPLHDHSNQYQGFGYFDHILDDTSRVSAIVGASKQTFEIPNVSGLQPDLGLTVNGRTSFASEDLDERQREATTYGILTYLKTTDKLTAQASLFARYSQLTYDPDVTGELLFDGIAQAARKTDLSIGTQIEGAYTLNDTHTVRGGVIISTDRTTSKTNSQVLAVDGDGVPLNDTPESIVDNGKNQAWSYSAFLQDEWDLTPELTLNYGLRFDQVDAFRRENQLSPRVNLVWKPLDGTTLHGGYARYFTPPPFELVASQTIGKFVGTTAQAPGSQNDLPRAERDNYFDVGVEQRVMTGLTVGLDAYYKKAKNLLDEGQFGAPIILTPFNYARGYAKGVELSTNYSHGAFSGYVNLAWSQAKGRDIVSSQFNFDPADLAYIAGHYIYLDHDQTYTASAGASYRLGPVRLSADVLYGSGLRRDGAVPNGGQMPGYTQVNFGGSYEVAGLPGGPLTLHADLINAFDKRYGIRDGSGVGVGAPQFGPRRGVFAGVTKAF